MEAFIIVYKHEMHSFANEYTLAYARSMEIALRVIDSYMENRKANYFKSVLELGNICYSDEEANGLNDLRFGYYDYLLDKASSDPVPVYSFLTKRDNLFIWSTDRGGVLYFLIRKIEVFDMQHSYNIQR